MNMLAVEELQDLGRQLLCQEVCNENQSTFIKSVCYQPTLSNKQTYILVSILNNFSNTHLSGHRFQLQESLRFYRKQLRSINIVAQSLNEVTLQWQYNADLHTQLKQLQMSINHSKPFYWTKSEEGWRFHAKLSYIPNLIPLFEQYGFDVSDLNILTSATRGDIKITLKVTRHSEDMLLLRFTPSLYEVESIMLQFPDVIKLGKNYKIYIDQALDIYNSLPSNVNKSDLSEWAALVQSWLRDYELKNWQEFPSLPFTPYNFQPIDAKQLLDLRRGLNANEVGCGKTFEQILIGESIPKTKLVICPATLRLNWQREILNVNPNATVHILYSNQPYKIVKGWNIISYDSLRVFQEKLETEMIPVIIADEAHYIQAISSNGTPSSIRAKNVLRLASTAGWVFPVTGTPKTNRNKNIYNILRMIRHPLTRGKGAWKRFCNSYCSNGDSTNDEDLFNQIKPYTVRHLKRDVLPDLQKQRQVIPVDINLEQYYKKIEDYMSVREYKDARALVALNAAKQIVAKQKVSYTIEHAKNFISLGEKVVVVTCYTDVVTALEQSFGPKLLKIVGGMTDNQKQSTIDKFQSDERYPIIVLNYDAGGVGITLTVSHIIILNDLPWTPGTVSQAEGRIWRTGQVQTAMVYFMVANKCVMDNIMVDILVNKSKSINTAIDGGFGENIDIRGLLDQAFQYYYNDKANKSGVSETLKA